MKEFQTQPINYSNRTRKVQKLFGLALMMKNSQKLIPSRTSLYYAAERLCNLERENKQENREVKVREVLLLKLNLKELALLKSYCNRRSSQTLTLN